MRVGSSAGGAMSRPVRAAERAAERPRHLRHPVGVDGRQLGQLAPVDDGPDARAEERAPQQEPEQRRRSPRCVRHDADLLGVEAQRADLERLDREQAGHRFVGRALHARAPHDVDDRRGSARRRRGRRRASRSCSPSRPAAAGTPARSRTMPEHRAAQRPARSARSAPAGRRARRSAPTPGSRRAGRWRSGRC